MDTKYIAEIKAREQAATPGPWIVKENRSFGIQSENKNIASCFRRENENFIAHARTDIPALIAEVERLQNLCEENEQLIERLANQSRRLNDSGVTKDQQIATLKKALRTIESMTYCTPTKTALLGIREYIQQAQEQEAEK